MVIWAVSLVAAMKALESAFLIPTSALFIPTTGSDTTDIIIWLVFQAITFCLVAFLGGNLAGKLKANRQELIQKQDIEKAYEALRQANESKSRLLTNVSHNLRTPLTSIIGFSELLIGRQLCQAEGEEYAGIIYREAQSLAHLINDSFYLSELQSEIPPWKLTEVNVADIVSRVVENFRDTAESKGLTISSMNNTQELPVWGNSAALRDSLIRLVDNAVKFTPKGSITVKSAAEAGYALISIADTGIGIPPAAHEIVFEPLGEIYKSEHKSVPQRTGLGLAICRAIVEHHHGDIRFESIPDRGTTFYLKIPLR
jgi:signal transduction histidine kinase